MNTSKVLNDIIGKYKKELLNKTDDYNPELEIRFKNIDYAIFNTVYQHFLKSVDRNDVFITQVISSLMKSKTEEVTKIQNIYYQNKKKGHNELISKTRIHVPYRQELNMFIVVLSLEKKITQKFITDENAIIRIKNRISFIIIENNNKWRIDMSIVKQIQGNEANNRLQSIVNVMFKEFDITIDNIVSTFKDRSYSYEIEAELLESQQITENMILQMGQHILFISNPSYLSEIKLQNKIYEVAKYIISSPAILQQYQQKLGLKQLLPKVQTLTRYDYKDIFPLFDYYITDKADGVRAIGMVDKSHGYIITDILRIYERSTPENMDMITIVDGEYYEQTKTLYVFDVIVINNVNISQYGFDLRIEKLEDAVRAITAAGIMAESKPYIRISDNIQDSVMSIYNRKRPYEIDGLIFVKPGSSYIQTKTYKWKEVKNNTIDFLVKKAPIQVLGQQPYITKTGYTLYFLFVGISRNMYQNLGIHLCAGYNYIFTQTDSIYFPIQFCPSNAPLAYLYYHPNTNTMPIDNAIVEFTCIDNCAGTEGFLIKWEPIKIRTDRQKDLETKSYYGNDYKVAEINWMNYLDPLTIEQLWLNVSDSDYFMTNKSHIYRTQTGVISFLKSKRISQYQHTNWIVDIGSGKGQDLGRYFSANIKNLITIDNDKASLSELVRRKFTFANANDKHKKSTNVYVVLADMTSSYTHILSKLDHIIPQNIKVDCIICNLSIHYYIYTSELLLNFIMFVNNILKKSGHLVITCFFGELIFNQLKDINEGGTWTIYEDSIIKYSIKKLYSSDKLEQFGQKIGVVLPFSKGEYYEEYLVNTNHVIKMFNDNGYTLLSKSNINPTVIDNFKLDNPSASKLSNDDKTYLSLYGEIILQKQL